MIRLDVDGFCKNCPDFEANVDRMTCTDGCGEVLTDTTVSCKHRVRCLSIREYLREEMTKEETEGKKC